MYGNGPSLHPPGPDGRCYWGSRGLRIVVRDSTRAIVGRFWAAVVSVLTVGTVTGVFVVVNPNRHEGNLGKVPTVLLGVVIGVVIAVAIVSALEALPVARRFHWRVEEQWTAEGAGIVFLFSMHWHPASRIWCSVTAPDRSVQNFEGRMGGYGMVVPHSYAVAVEYAQLVPLQPGKYRFRWQIICPERSRPLTVARRRVGPRLPQNNSSSVG
jgi:hypothetical protein